METRRRNLGYHQRMTAGPGCTWIGIHGHKTGSIIFITGFNTHLTQKFIIPVL